jgi:hypothetical protein
VHLSLYPYIKGSIDKVEIYRIPHKKKDEDLAVCGEGVVGSILGCIRHSSP